MKFLSRKSFFTQSREHIDTALVEAKTKEENLANEIRRLEIERDEVQRIIFAYQAAFDVLFDAQIEEGLNDLNITE